MISNQHETLNAKLRGHDAYFGITGNYRMLELLRRQVARIWRKWLSHRSRNSKATLNWASTSGSPTSGAEQPVVAPSSSADPTLPLEQTRRGLRR